MSLDGFMTAANVRSEEPLGDGGQRLHEWTMGGKVERNRKYLEDAIEVLGAVVAGRRTYDTSVAWWADGLRPSQPAEHPSERSPVVCHDEVVVECDAEQVADVKDWLEKAMIERMDTVINDTGKAPVPVEVEARTVRSWGDRS